MSRERSQPGFLTGWFVYAAGALLSALLTAGWVLGVVLPSWNTADTIVSGLPHTRSEVPPSPALARRLHVVVVDGLSHQAAEASEAWRPLREAGAFRPLQVDFPSFTSPAIVAMFVGQGPLESGVRLNGAEEGAPGLDSALESAWDAGVYVRVRSRGFAPFERLVRPPRQADIRRGRLAAAFELAIPDVLPRTSPLGRAELVTVSYLGEVDEAGHKCGSDCTEYRQASEDAGQLVSRIASRLDPDKDLLFALSDHGMRPEGGHGGDEVAAHDAFFLAWGAGVRRDEALGPRHVRDVASTITTALGAPCPSSNLGSPMLDLFALGETERSRRMANPFATTASYQCALDHVAGCDRIAQISGQLERGGSAADANALLEALEAARQARSSKGERVALGRLCAGVSFSLALLWLLRGRLRALAWPSRRAALGLPGALFASYALVLIGFGYEPTLSAMTGTEVFLPDAMVAVLVATVACGAAAFLLRLRPADGVFALATVWGCLVPIFAHAGADPHRIAPPLSAVLTFQLAPLIAAASLTMLLTVAFAARRESSRPLTTESR